MYKPVRPRPKKTNIVRSRTGCQNCRERRTKCDEQKPSCGTCTRLGKSCTKIQIEFKFQPNSLPRSQASLSEKPQGRRRELVRENQEPNQPSHHREFWFAGFDSMKSLQHTDRDVFYETHWEAICLPAVHPLFRSRSASAWKYPILKDAFLALSACNISRLNPECKTASNNGMVRFGPNLAHQTRSQLYYSSAIKRFNTTWLAKDRGNAGIISMVLIVFAYLESSMGNFEGFYCHVQGLTTFLGNSRDALGDEHLNELMVAWQQVRYVVWWARVYFSSLEIQRGLLPVPMPSLLDGCLDSIHGRRIMALNIMCESHRLKFQDLLRHWGPATESHKSSDEVYACLAVEARKSDQWLLNLPGSEQPMKSDWEGDLNAPIYFHSHDAALNFAYYVTGRIMQCTDSLGRLDAQIYPSHDFRVSPEDDWVRLLIRIASGIDMQTAISRNSYTIGFSSLFIPAILRCQGLILGIEIQEWLENLLRLQPTEEGAFPIYQTLAIVQAINHQRLMDREIFGVSQPVDDGGGTPKFACFNS